LREIHLIKKVEQVKRVENKFGILKRQIQQAQPVVLGGSGGDGGAAD
jgi:hypothetical protein